MEKKKKPDANILREERRKLNRKHFKRYLFLPKQ